MQKTSGALCSGDLQIGDDGDDAYQNAHQEMGAPKYLDTKRPGFLQAARSRARLTLGIVVVLLFGSGVVGATPPPQDIDPEAWAKVRAQLDAQGLHPARAKAARDVPVETAKLLPTPDWSGEGAEFGRAVSVDGDLMVVGAYGDDDSGVESGSAYVFERNQGGVGAWSEAAKLTASGGAAEDSFGHSVAVSGDTMVVGDFTAEIGNFNPGWAYVFERNHGGADPWGRVAILNPSERYNEDFYGRAVSIGGDTVVVGAYGRDDLGSDSGSTFVFEMLRDPEVVGVGSTPTTADGVLTEGEWSSFGFTDLGARFNVSMADPVGDTEPGDVTNPSAASVALGDGECGSTSARVMSWATGALSPRSARW